MSTPPQLESYRILHVAGAGAMGEVWRAEHRRTGIPVAIKRVPDTADRRRRAYQLAEIRATAALDHPHIVRIVDVGVLDDGSHWMALEWCGGGTLARVESWPELRRAVLQVLAGLGHAHARHVVHRDIKPGNILRDDAGSWRLADFGVARIGAEPTGPVVGSPYYIAPEVIERHRGEHGIQADLYSLGCTVWEQVCGAAPFRASDLQGVLDKHVNAPLPPLRPRFDIPDTLHDWLRWLLDKDPTQRPACAAEAAGHLERPGTWRPRLEGLSTARGRDTRLRDTGVALLPYREPVLVGREAALETLGATFERVVEEDRPHLVVLTGPPGVGRSRLATHFAQEAHAQGLATRALASLDGVGVAAASRLFGGLTPAALAHWRRDRPAVIGLDDLEDPPTAHAIGTFVTRCRGPILWLVTAATVPRHLVARLPDADWSELAVAALPSGALARILDDTVTLSPSLASSLIRDADGLPGRALDQLVRWASEGRLVPGAGGFELAAADPAPDGTPLPHPVRVGLQLLALAGGHLPVGLWEAACQAAGLELDWELLLGPVAAEGFRLDGEIAGLGPAAAAHWEERARASETIRPAATALLALLGEDDERRGALLWAAGRAAEATDALLAASATQRRIGDRGYALTLATRANEAAATTGDPARLWASRNQLLRLWMDTWQVDRAHRAMERWEPELHTAPVAQRAGHRTRRATVMRYRGHHDCAIAELTEAEALLEHVDDDAEHALILFECASQRLSMGYGESAEAQAARVVQLAPTDELRAYAALTVGRTRAWSGDDVGAIAALEEGLVWAEAAERPITAVQMLSMLGEAHSRRGSTAVARALYEQAVARAARLPHFDGIMLELNRVGNDVRHGAYEAAWQRASELALDPRARRLTIARVGASLMKTAAAAGLGRWDAFAESADGFLGFLDKYPKLSDPDFRAFALLCRELTREAPEATRTIAEELVEATGPKP